MQDMDVTVGVQCLPDSAPGVSPIRPWEVLILFLQGKRGKERKREGRLRANNFALTGKKCISSFSLPLDLKS